MRSRPRTEARVRGARLPDPQRLGEAMIPRETLIAELGHIVGPGQVLTSARDTRGYTRGFRYGSGPVAAVVRPGSLVEQWRVLNASIAAGRIVIFQAANTGLTGGSTPWGDDYDREIVLVSLRRLKGVHLIDGGRQVVCLPGATLDALEKALRPLGTGAAFGDRVVLHRRLGARRHLQQLRRRADPARAGLYRDDALRRGPRGRLRRPRQPPRPAARQRPRGDPRPRRARRPARARADRGLGVGPRIRHPRPRRGSRDPCPLQRRSPPPARVRRLRRQARGLRGAPRHLRGGG